jgi:hypothetical protein
MLEPGTVEAGGIDSRRLANPDRIAKLEASRCDR